MTRPLLTGISYVPSYRCIRSSSGHGFSVTHLIPSKIPLVLGGAHYLRTLLCISEPHSYAGLNSQCYLHRPIFLTMIRIYLYNTLSSKSQMLLCCFPIRIAIIISLFVNKNYITHKRSCCISHDTAQYRYFVRELSQHRSQEWLIS